MTPPGKAIVFSRDRNGNTIFQTDPMELDAAMELLWARIRRSTPEVRRICLNYIQPDGERLDGIAVEFFSYPKRKPWRWPWWLGGTRKSQEVENVQESVPS